MKACQNCVHSRPRRPVQTAMERWLGDTRPERPKGLLGLLSWFWNSAKYRDEIPYTENHEEDDDWGMRRAYDSIELNARKNNLMCTLNPKHREVQKQHYCGQFEGKEECEA